MTPQDRQEVENVFPCELDRNHCVTGTSPCEFQRVIEGCCKYYKCETRTEIEKSKQERDKYKRAVRNLAVFFKGFYNALSENSKRQEMSKIAGLEVDDIWGGGE